MRFLITAVLLCIACIAFAGCGMDEDENDAYWQEVYDYNMSNEPNIERRWTHRDWLEIEDPLNHRIHVSECKRWNYNWLALPYQDANYWQGRYSDEGAKPAHKQDYAKAMTDPDTGIRFHIGGWLKSGGVITGRCCSGN